MERSWKIYIQKHEESQVLFQCIGWNASQNLQPIVIQLCCGNSYPHQISSDWGPCMRRQLVRCPTEASVLYISPESPSPTALWAILPSKFEQVSREYNSRKLVYRDVSWTYEYFGVLYCGKPNGSQWHKPSGSIWGCINHPFMVILITFMVIICYNWCYHVLPHFINVIDVSSCTACIVPKKAHGAHGCAGDTWLDLTISSCCCMVIIGYPDWSSNGHGLAMLGSTLYWKLVWK